MLKRKTIKKRGGYGTVFKGCSSCSGNLFDGVQERHSKATRTETGILNFLDKIKQMGIFEGGMNAKNISNKLREASRNERNPIYQFADSVVKSLSNKIEDIKNIEGF